MRLIYRLMACLLQRDARGTVHSISSNGKVTSGWIYGGHGWHIDMPNQYDIRK